MGSKRLSFTVTGAFVTKTARDYLDFNGPGIGSLEICFGGPRTATLRFAPELPQESRSEAAQEPSTIDHPTTPGETETRSSRRPCDLRKACESEDN